jgi:hypothetical protein
MKGLRQEAAMLQKGQRPRPEDAVTPEQEIPDPSGRTLAEDATTDEPLLERFLRVSGRGRL